MRVCSDPYARCFLRGRLYLIGEARVPEHVGVWLQRRFAPGFHDYFVARTRFIDDALTSAVGDGVTQVVILGAGYDSRAYRIPALRAIKVVEVDQPATQQDKIARVRVCIGETPHVAFVPIDFTTQSLAGALTAETYDRTARTFFLWEGVTPYIDAFAVDATLAFIRESSGSGSIAVFDYLDEEALLGRSSHRAVTAWVSRTRRTREPVRFGIDPSQIGKFVGERGLKPTAHAAAADLNERYFKPFHGHRAVTPAFAIAQVQVP